MPIEDVDYLKQNSIKQSYIFLSDSAERNRVAYPTPSEYVLNFSQPFTNVIGLEVIDASIPRTMYNVDVINNKVAFYIYKTAPGTDAALEAAAPPQFQVTEVDIGEYTIQTLLPKLTEALHMHPGDDSSLPEVTITAESLSNPSDVRSTVRFTCPYPFALNMPSGPPGMDGRTGWMSETLGFDLLPSIAESRVTPLKRRYEVPWTEVQADGLPNTMFKSVDLDPDVALGTERTVFEGPRGVIRNIRFTSPTKKISQKFTVDANGYLTGIFVAFSSALSDVPSATTVHFAITTGATAPSASATALTSGTIAISYIDGGLSDATMPALTQPVLLVPGVTYWLVLTCTDSNIGVFYNDVIGEAGGLLIGEQGTIPSSIDTADVTYHMAARVVVSDPYHSIIAPGIFSLVGPRFLLIRCPEIEENSFRSLAYNKHFIGLAKIRLGVVGYSENRLDYSTVPTREFHPIGRLSRLTLRFTLPDGSLYDFKGVNHTVTFAVHYYEPAPKVRFEQSVIQPNYNGNIMEYLFNQEEDESDEEEPVDNYRQQELMYMPENLRRRDLDALQRFPMQERLDHERFVDTE